MLFRSMSASTDEEIEKRKQKYHDEPDFDNDPRRYFQWLAQRRAQQAVAPPKRIIDLENPDLLPVFDLHAAPVTALAELPDGRIASSGSDGIYVWSTEDMGEEFVRFTGHRQRTVTLLGLPDGRLVSSAIDGRVRIWDLRDQGQDAETVIDVPGIVNPVVIQADNGLFVAGASRGYVVFTIE